MSTSSTSKTTTVNTTTRKTPVARKTPAKKLETTQPVAAAPEAPVPSDLRKRELIEAVVLRSGVKKRDAKPVIEAMLAELGENLAAGRDLTLPPLGKVKVAREKDTPNGRVIVVRVRQNDRTIVDYPKATAAE